MTDVDRRLEKIAHELAESALGFMRASVAAAQDGCDAATIQRRHIIAMREYEWSAHVWSMIGDWDKHRRCLELSASIRENRWQDPEQSCSG